MFSRSDNRHYDGPKYLGLSGTPLSRIIGFAACAGFLLLGYDQGVMGSLLTLPSFNEVFPEINSQGKSGTSREATMQGVTIGLYEIGCLLGALSCLWLGDMLGRRKVIWIGTIIMIVGAIIQVATFGLAQLIVGRVITGIGNGMHTATIPMWQSECSPPHKRGMLVMVEGLLITGGICMAYWIDFAFYWLDPASRYPTEGPNAYDPLDFPHRSAAWRIPIAWQILLCIPTFITIWMPESPRWLLLRGFDDEARNVMASLDELSVDDPEIDSKMKEIKLSLDIASSKGVGDLFTQGKEKNFHRALLGSVSQIFQQITGINLITYYAGTIFETSIGMSALVSRIVAACNGTEYFIASVIAIYLIERVGRRKLMIFGAIGQAISMAILAACTSPAATRPNADGEAQNKAPSYVAAVFLFVFNTFFAIGWLGMTWLYPAEITPLSIRAAATGVSTACNWIFNFLVVLITPIAFSNIQYRTYIIFAVINAAIAITSYFVFVETAGRSLEEMSGIFEHASVWNPYDVVKIEKRTPRRYDHQGRPMGLDNVFAEQGEGQTATEVNEEKEKKEQQTMLETRSHSSE